MSTKQISKEELKKHNKKEDGWIAIRGKVYNVTQFFDDHPGGAGPLMANLGKDATDDFDALHSESALKHAEPFLVGVLAQSAKL